MSGNSASELLQAAQKTAAEVGLDELKPRLLMAELLGVSFPALALQKNQILTSGQIQLFQHQIKRLHNHEPLQYILGKAHFYGLELSVNPSVLIPRPETEGLVEWVHQENPGAVSALEIGTGSGAISIALKSLQPKLRMTATDISLPALTLAKHNAHKLGLDVSFVLADLFPPHRNGRYEVIVSNPPYVSTSEYETLDKEVRLYEPKLALAAGKDGLTCYRRILAKAGKYLAEAGKLYLEIGESQAAAISELAIHYGFGNVAVKQDLAGKDRYLRISV